MLADKEPLGNAEHFYLCILSHMGVVLDVAGELRSYSTRPLW